MGLRFISLYHAFYIYIIFIFIFFTFIHLFYLLTPDWSESGLHNKNTVCCITTSQKVLKFLVSLIHHAVKNMCTPVHHNLCNCCHIPETRWNFLQDHLSIYLSSVKDLKFFFYLLNYTKKNKRREHKTKLPIPPNTRHKYKETIPIRCP